MARLNMAQVQELKEIMEDAFDDLIATYIQDSEDKLKLLRQAVKNSDDEGISGLGHSLKGSSLNICAEDLSVIFRQIEDAGRAKDLSTMDQLLVQALTEFDGLKTALTSL
jgi:HPt (histidine-containing phosphotransfer) domain-containing protein